MKVELVSYLAGGLALEVIAESELEAKLLKHSWRTMQEGSPPRVGNGQTMTGFGSVGFYLPITPSHIEPDPPTDPAAR